MILLSSGNMREIVCTTPSNGFNTFEIFEEYMWRSFEDFKALFCYCLYIEGTFYYESKWRSYIKMLIRYLDTDFYEFDLTFL